MSTPPPSKKVGGSLDTAFKMVRWLSWYADHLNVYVPRKAKSASTLVALGATRVYLSPFGELGPLDTKIEDPRNPTTYVSALDCYQSMDHVRRFGVATINEALTRLSDFGRGQISLADLVGTASDFSVGAIAPMLRVIRALDFGAWGRSLEIGEKYARILLLNNHTQEEAETIATRLVYHYTHHLFPIDYKEACDIGLKAKVMSKETYDSAMEVIDECHRKAFVGFVSDREFHAPEVPQEAPAEEHGEGAGMLEADALAHNSLQPAADGQAEPASNTQRCCHGQR